MPSSLCSNLPNDTTAQIPFFHTKYLIFLLSELILSAVFSHEFFFIFYFFFILLFVLYLCMFIYFSFSTLRLMKLIINTKSYQYRLNKMYQRVLKPFLGRLVGSLSSWVAFRDELGR